MWVGHGPILSSSRVRRMFEHGPGLRDRCGVWAWHVAGKEGGWVLCRCSAGACACVGSCFVGAGVLGFGGFCMG